MRYFSFLLAGLAAYVAALFLSNALFVRGIEAPVLRLCLSLLPMLPAMFICGVIVRTIRRMDERQRKLQFEALVFAFAGTALITFGYGFLEGTGLPRLSMFVVWPMMATLWVVGLAIGKVRYG
jgi:hypothetical protein